MIGATGSISEYFAHYLYSLEKMLIVTGREQEKVRLSELAQELSGLRYRLVRATYLQAKN